MFEHIFGLLVNLPFKVLCYTDHWINTIIKKMGIKDGILKYLIVHRDFF